MAIGTVFLTAECDDPAIAETFIDLLKGNGKTFIYTSGGAIVAHWNRQETADFVYTQDFPLETQGLWGGSLAINTTILRAAREGVHPVVIVPGMVYGPGG